jgi:glucosyl-dolichyl phosphate glucuronosyltransferase
MDISVIIPTYDRTPLLTRTVRSLLALDVVPGTFEILVVDNAVSTQTRAAIGELASGNPQQLIRYIPEPVPGLLAGRHRGALESGGEIAVFIDDDVRVDRDWLAGVQVGFQSDDVHLVGGRNLPEYESAAPAWIDAFWNDHEYGRWCMYLSLLDFGVQEQTIHPQFVFGLNFAIRRKTLFDLGGFHPDCVPSNLQRFQGDGETGLSLKIAQHELRAMYQPTALLHHWIPTARMTAGYFEQRQYYQGVCDSYTRIRQQGGVALEVEVHTSDGSAATRPGWRQYARRVKRSIRNLRTNSLTARPSEAELIKQRMQSGYQAGYAFHQHQVRHDPRLQEWVLRENYWDYSYPEQLIPMNS